MGGGEGTIHPFRSSLSGYLALIDFGCGCKQVTPPAVLLERRWLQRLALFFPRSHLFSEH